MPKDVDLTPQVALWCRKLSVLLRLNVPILLALEMLAEEFADLCDVTLLMREDIRAGGSFSDAVNRQKATFTRFARVIIVAGEHSGDLIGALAQLADCLAQQAHLRIRRTLDFEERLQASQRGTESPAIYIAQQALKDAIRAEATELHIIPDATGAILKLMVGGIWRRMVELSPQLYPAVARRMKVLANIPYWITEPAMGQIAVHEGDEIWDFAVRVIPVTGTEEGRIEMSLRKRNGGEEPA